MLKVGDRVKSNQPGQEYTGTIEKIDSYRAFVDRDDGYACWSCKVVGDKIATADGVWDQKSFLEKIGKTGRPAKIKPTLYVAFYKENKVDPMKEFADLKELKKWLAEAEHDSSIDFDSIIVVPVDQKQGILKINRTSTFTLTKV